MFSTLLELLGFAAFVAATYIVAGLAGALYVAGGSLLFIAYAIDDESVASAAGRLAAPVRARFTTWRARRAQKKAVSPPRGA
jgi:hypothetical protein